MNRIYCGDCLDVLPQLLPAACIFADPPDNIGLGYDGFLDRKSETAYCNWLLVRVAAMLRAAPIVWISFNARWTPLFGIIASAMRRPFPDLEIKPCVQTFTFGQHNKHDLGNDHRPLWRLRRGLAPLYPDAIRVRSCRQQNGDKRADPRGRVPGDVFSFPRVTGNSRQRRRWHPTQLHEGLVERCILLSTKPGDRVIDCFGGTGTTLRVCQRIGRLCDLIEVSRGYCERVAKEFPESQTIGV